MSFSVTKTAQSFVRPSKPTPSETLSLSIIDRFPGPRTVVKSLHIFKHGQQPAEVIREALSKALVLYYPFAGRFVVSDQGEDKVECNGKGVWFIQAIANYTLEDIKYLYRVPLMISKNDLFPEPPPETKILDVPTMMQVTEFRCGSFVVSFVYNHDIADGMGAAQFMSAIGDFACGNTTPSIKPIWSRDLIPNPPKPPPEASSEPFPSFNLCIYNFDLPMDYITKMKSDYLESSGQNCTAFDIFAATVWQMRTRAINIDDPITPVNLCFIANIRHLLTPEFLPREGGYYGNCYYHVNVSASNNKIVNGKVVDIVNIIRDGKAKLPKEVEMWKNGELKKYPWELTITYETLIVSDTTYLGFTEVDHGWGKPIHITHLMDSDFNEVKIARPLVMTQCVKEENLSAFQEQVRMLVSDSCGRGICFTNVDS